MAKRAPIGTAIGLVRLGVLLVCLPRVVDAQGQLVLLPQATQRLEACFASRADGWSLPDAQVTPQRVQGKACLQENCLHFTIAAPAPTCAGHAMPAGCVQFADGGAADQASLTTVLQTLPTLWTEVHPIVAKPAPPQPPPPAWPSRWPALLWLGAVVLTFALARMRSPTAAWVSSLTVAGALPAAWQIAGGLQPWWLALEVAYKFHSGPSPRFASIGVMVGLVLWFLIPGALVVLLGRALRLVQQHQLRLALAWAIPLLLAASASVGALLLPLWDALGMALLAGGGAAWLSTSPARPAARALLTLTVLSLGLLVLEGGLRLLAPMQPLVSPAKESPFFADDHLVNTIRLTEPGYCVPWQGHQWPSAACKPFRPEHQRRVLHVGDSCLQGANVTLDERVTAVLERMQPLVTHINAGEGGTSIDTQAHVARAWLENGHLDAILIHAYPCNDLHELDSPRTYCGDTPLLRYHDDTASFACDSPSAPASTFGLLLHYSPPPFPLHWATYDSLLARALIQPFTNVGMRQPTPTTDPETARAHYGAALRLLRDEAARHHVPVAGVLLPIRDSACSSLARGEADALRQLFHTAHVPLLDTIPTFDAEVKRLGEAGVFVDRPRGDTHPNGQSQARLAAEVIAAWPRLFPTVPLP